jgi:heme-degrading monooxygenase HmoA
VITVGNHIYVAPEYMEQFETNFHNRAGLVDRMPGFLFNQLLRPVAPDGAYIVLTYWESRSAFDAWVKSDAFVRGHARSRTLPAAAFARPSHVEIHEVIQDSRDPDLLAEPRGTPMQIHSVAAGSSASD